MKILVHTKTKIKKISELFLTIISLPSVYKLKNKYQIIIIFILLLSSLIITTGLIVKINNFIISNMIYLLCLVNLLYLIFNFVIRIYNVFFRMLQFFIKKSNRKKNIIFSYYIYNIICFILSSFLIIKIFNSLMIYTDTDELYIYIFYISILFGILYIYLISEEDITIKYFKLTKFTYILVFINLVILCLAVLGLFNLNIMKLLLKNPEFVKMLTCNMMPSDNSINIKGENINIVKQENSNEQLTPIKLTDSNCNSVKQSNIQSSASDKNIILERADRSNLDSNVNRFEDLTEKKIDINELDFLLKISYLKDWLKTEMCEYKQNFYREEKKILENLNLKDININNQPLIHFIFFSQLEVFKAYYPHIKSEDLDTKMIVFFNELKAKGVHTILHRQINDFIIIYFKNFYGSGSSRLKIKPLFDYSLKLDTIHEEGKSLLNTKQNLSAENMKFVHKPQYDWLLNTAKDFFNSKYSKYSNYLDYNIIIINIKENNNYLLSIYKDLPKLLSNIKNKLPDKVSDLVNEAKVESGTVKNLDLANNNKLKIKRDVCISSRIKSSTEVSLELFNKEFDEYEKFNYFNKEVLTDENSPNFIKGFKNITIRRK